MILKLGMKHQGMEVYKICLNDNPGMTLTYFTASLTLVAHAWVKLLKCHLKGKSCSKSANGLNFYDLKKSLTPGFIPTLACDYIQAITILESNKFIYIR